MSGSGRAVGIGDVDYLEAALARMRRHCCVCVLSYGKDVHAISDRQQYGTVILQISRSGWTGSVCDIDYLEAVITLRGYCCVCAIADRKGVHAVGSVKQQIVSIFQLSDDVRTVGVCDDDYLEAVAESAGHCRVCVPAYCEDAHIKSSSKQPLMVMFHLSSGSKICRISDVDYLEAVVITRCHCGVCVISHCENVHAGSSAEQQIGSILQLSGGSRIAWISNVDYLEAVVSKGGRCGVCIAARCKDIYAANTVKQ